MPENNTVPAMKPRWTSKQSLVSIVVAVAAGLVGFGIGYGMGVDNPPKGGYDAGYQASRNKFQEAGFLPASDVRTLVGTVVSIDGNSISIDVLPESYSLIDDEGPVRRRVTVIDGTVVESSMPKSPEDIEKAQMEYQDAMREFMENPAASLDGEPPRPTSPFETMTISVSDIKIGDKVTVRANENINTIEEFNAISVTLNIK